MRVCRSRSLLAMLVATAFLVSAAPQILCVHSDGNKAIEDGSDWCCLFFQGQPHQMASSATSSDGADGCPGCTDLVLRSDSQRTRSSSEIAAPSMAALGLPTPASVASLVPASMFRLLPEAASPPHTSPLRI